MKKLIKFGAMALTMGMFIYSCEKENVNSTKNTSHSNNNIVEDLHQIFNEIQGEEDNVNAKSSSNLSVPLANKQNPFDNDGLQHNEVLSYIMSLGLDESNVCSSLGLVSKEFQVKIDLSCNELISLINDGSSKTFDDERNYKSVLLNDLLNRGNISENEFQVVNTTIEKVYNLTNLNQKITLLKASENYTRNSQFLTDIEKERIQRTFAIYRYSSFYWEVDAIELAAGPGASAADALMYYWALNSEYSPAQDGKDAYAIAGAVSAAFVILGF